MQLYHFVFYTKENLDKFQAWWLEGDRDTHPLDMGESDWMEHFLIWLEREGGL